MLTLTSRVSCVTVPAVVTLVEVPSSATELGLKEAAAFVRPDALNSTVYVSPTVRSLIVPLQPLALVRVAVPHAASSL